MRVKGRKFRVDGGAKGGRGLTLEVLQKMGAPQSYSG
jgi:hypothetical protein